jgi:hypothetical protein
MAPRYDHFLQPAKGGRWPQRLICVDCQGTYGPVSGHPAREAEQLARWSALCLTRQAPTYTIVCQIAGSRADTWWQGLAELLDRPGTVWILSYRCARIWSLLNLWERIEDERLLLTTDPGRARTEAPVSVRDLRPDGECPPELPAAASVRQLRKQIPGFLVIEDPPNILRGRLPGRPGRLLWLDVRNWGMECPADCAAGNDVSAWLASSLGQMAPVLHALNLGSLQATAASQAMHGYRCGYYTGGIYCHAERRVLKGEAASYYGGRAEAFRLGAIGPALWHVDYRSQYASVCANSRLPVRLAGELQHPGRADAEQHCHGTAALARVTLDTDEPAYPYRVGAYTIWPVGRFTTTLAGPELLDALVKERIVRWHWIAWYEMEEALRDYAKSLSHLRDTAERDGARTLASMVKRLLVSLPGKLGQRVRTWQLCPDGFIDLLYGEWLGRDSHGAPTRFRSIGGTVWREVIGDFLPDAVPAMAAWITSEARVRLLNAIRTAGWEHVYYVDTDSLFVDEEGWWRLRASGLVRPGQLGFLRLLAGPAVVEIRGIKYYVQDGQVTCAGLPRGVCTDAGTGNHYWYELTPTEAARKGLRPAAVRELRPYQRRPEYLHGMVGDDGRVTPFRLDER